MVTQWAPGPLHPKGRIRVSQLQEAFFTLDIFSVCVSECGYYTAQAQESLLDSGATKKAFFILGR